MDLEELALLQESPDNGVRFRAVGAADAADEMREAARAGLGQEPISSEDGNAEQIGSVELGTLVEDGHSVVGVRDQQRVDNNFSVSTSPQNNDEGSGEFGLG